MIILILLLCLHHYISLQWDVHCILQINMRCSWSVMEMWDHRSTSSRGRQQKPLNGELYTEASTVKPVLKGCSISKGMCPYMTVVPSQQVPLHIWKKEPRSEETSPVQRVSSHRSVPWRHIYCIEGGLSSECSLKTGLLYRGCPLIRVSLEDRFTV